jgi:cell division protease FtsH
MEDFEHARDKITMGAERKSMVMTEKEKENTAYHEAGHAIIGYLVPEHDPVHKVTIIPRGRALGVTYFLPEEDKYSQSKRYLLGVIATAYGGRIAEEMINGPDGVSTGASSDIEYATRMARNMVTVWGLSEKLGPVLFGEEPGAYPGMGARNYSAATSKIIDDEVKSIIDNCYANAVKILEEYRDVLEAMKNALMEYETIDSDQVADLMARRKVRPPREWNDDDFNSHLKSKDAGEKPSDPIGGPANTH